MCKDGYGGDERSVSRTLVLTQFPSKDLTVPYQTVESKTVPYSQALIRKITMVTRVAFLVMKMETITLSLTRRINASLTRFLTSLTQTVMV